MKNLKRISLCLAVLLASSSVAPAAILTFVYKDFINNPTNRGANNGAIYLDGTPSNQITPLPPATAFQLVATIDTTQPDTTHGDASNFAPGMQFFTPLAATLTVFTANGPQTYTLVQDFTSPYHIHTDIGENASDLNRTDVIVFDLTNRDMQGHVGIGFVEDPWIDGAGYIGDFAGTALGAAFSATNLTPNTFITYNGSGIQEGPGSPFPCGEGGTGAPCAKRYVEPIKLLGSDGQTYWFTMTDGVTNPGTYNGVSLNGSALITQSLGFQPMSPCRVVDTRKKVGLKTYLYGQNAKDVDFLGSACNIPSTAAAYSINVTVVPKKVLGYLTVYPKGQNMPVASTLNSVDGRVKSNAAIVQAGTSGEVTFYPTDDTDLVVDINGYFDPSTDPTALQFFPMTPCRLADTRKDLGVFGSPSMTGGAPRNFPVLAGSCGIPATAKAYAINYTAVPKGPLGYLTTWPGDSQMPIVSTLNATTGTVTANAAIVPAGSDGSINVLTSNDADVVMDVTGYFAPVATGGLSLYTMEACRAYDSRKVTTNAPPLTSETTVSILNSPCGIPSNAESFVLNATAVPSSALGFLTLWPDGQSQPLASTLNSLDGFVTSNLAFISSTNGAVDVFGSNPTHVILDASGYFAP